MMMQSEQQSDGQQPNQQGFTILESLVAILVVSILLVAISPVIVLSIGVRLQAKRVDSATRAASLYIDGVKSGEIEPPEHLVELKETEEDTDTGTNEFNSQRSVFAAASTPTTGTLSCAAGLGYCTDTSPYSLYCVDSDDADNECTADSHKDLIVQAFRSTLPTTTSVEPGYVLGVRVYRSDGFRDDEPLTTQEQLTASGGLGDRKGPLIEMTTEVVDADTTLSDYCQRLGGC